MHMYTTATLNKTPLDQNLMMFNSYIPAYTDARMAAQHGLFTWYRDVDKTHDAVIDDVLSHLVTNKRDEHGNLTQEVIKLPNVHELYGKTGADLGIPAIFDHVDLAIIGVAGWRTDHRAGVRHPARSERRGVSSTRRSRAW